MNMHPLIRVSAWLTFAPIQLASAAGDAPGGSEERETVENATDITIQVHQLFENLVSLSHESLPADAPASIAVLSKNVGTSCSPTYDANRKELIFRPNDQGCAFMRQVESGEIASLTLQTADDETSTYKIVIAPPATQQPMLLWVDQPHRPTSLEMWATSDKSPEHGASCHFFSDEWKECGQVAHRRWEPAADEINHPNGLVRVGLKSDAAGTAALAGAAVKAQATIPMRFRANGKVNGFLAKPTQIHPGSTETGLDWCRSYIDDEELTARDQTQFVCIDQADPSVPGLQHILRSVRNSKLEDTPEPASNLPIRTTLSNNMQTVFLVRVPSIADVTIGMPNGDIGFSDGVIRNDVVPGQTGQEEYTSGDPQRQNRNPQHKIIPKTVTTFSGGAVSLTTTFKANSSLGISAASYTHEFIADRRVHVVFRAGLAASYTWATNGEPVDRFEVTTPPGGTTSVLTEKNGDRWVDPRLTMGVTLFPWRYGKQKPLYESQLNKFQPGIYLGVGLVNLDFANITAAEAIPAGYIGPDFSFSKNFSLTPVFTIAARKVLDDTAYVGGPLTGEIPSRIAPALGFGLMVNLSPDAFVVTGKE